MVEVHGTVAAGFEGVREAFVRNFTHGGDVGAAVCVYRRGEKVVDLWGGLADPNTGRAWQQDTLQLVFSTSKGVTATVVHLLAERGLLDLDAPVARYWPEFAAGGKQDIPVRWLLSHQAGLPALAERVPLARFGDQDLVAARLAEQAPLWEPGTGHGYHAVTYGWLLGEVVRRVTGRSLGTVIAEEIAAPLGLDLYLGLPAELEPRASHTLPVPPAEPLPPEALAALPPVIAGMLKAFTDPDSLATKALRPTVEDFDANSRYAHAAEAGAVTSMGSAEGYARMYAATVGEVDGVRLLSKETVDRARAPQTSGPDKVLVVPNTWALGYIPFTPPSDLVPIVNMIGPGSFGHGGYGGSLAFGDVDHEIGFGYVMNQLQAGGITGEGGTAGNLVQALRAALQ
ncbi:CubicO group peptidase (beta-lactamase class C family) [Crossiella equi]|uniref:CubicO group peptidase (Beta-lactamase class C family) n=1 Tax=Crossiella equi TaxID=130796 RepID=A0ABS5A905_9PSEU|nr:serine hydrolase domain-containing protein [Crossiella equi]MBP2473063.1 CubicO group peptidase (beta-lactamase class C family) [Crossiella equi]